MMLIIKSLKDLSFGKLMEVYIESNRERAAEEWRNLPDGFALQRAEQDFYQYLRENFFPTQDAAYAVWEENGSYVCALRLEPYKDGLLLEALETRPENRKQGYAKLLVQSVQTLYSGKKIYSHVHKRNTASLRTHAVCGFRRIAEYAAYIDGSVNHRAYTLLFEE